MVPKASIPGEIRDEAAQWLARIEREPQLGQDRVFKAWLSADLRHRLAYAEIERAWRDSAALAQSPLAQGRTLSRAPLHMRRSTHLVALGACVILGVGLISVRFGPVPMFAVGTQVEARAYATAVGETRSWRLADGMSLTLHGDSRARAEVTTDAHRITLEKGRARVSVQGGNTRPLEIRLKGLVVSTTGGVIDMVASTASLHLTVVEGDADLRKPDGMIRHLEQGGQYSDPPGSAAASVAGDDTGEPGAAMTQAQTMTLGQAVRLLNRANALQIRLEGPGLARRELSGSIRLDDPKGFVDTLEALGGIAIDQRAGVIVVRSS